MPSVQCSVREEGEEKDTGREGTRENQEIDRHRERPESKDQNNEQITCGWWRQEQWGRDCFTIKCEPRMEGMEAPCS